MVNVYIFYVDSSTPSGFTEIGETYQNRLIKLGGTALQTGGSSTHDHSGSVSSISTYSADSAHKGVSSGEEVLASASHTHPSGTVNSVSGVSNYPAYTKIRMIYRNVSGWNGVVPAGGVICKEGSASGWSDLGYTGFVNITNTYGTSVSQESHSHSVSASLNALSASGGLTSKSGSAYAYRLHGHSSSSTTLSSDVTYDYYYAAIRFIKASTYARYVMKDGICLFDGNPGDHWTLVDSYNDRFLKFGSGSWETGGSYSSYSHSHSGSATSGGSNTNYQIEISGGTGYYIFPASHTHTFNISLNSTDAEPPWFRLIPYKSDLDFASSLPVLCGNVLSAI